MCHHTFPNQSNGVYLICRSLAATFSCFHGVPSVTVFPRSDAVVPKRIQYYGGLVQTMCPDGLSCPAGVRGSYTIVPLLAAARKGPAKGECKRDRTRPSGFTPCQQCSSLPKPRRSAPPSIVEASCRPPRGFAGSFPASCPAGVEMHPPSPLGKSTSVPLCHCNSWAAFRQEALDPAAKGAPACSHQSGGVSGRSPVLTMALEGPRTSRLVRARALPGPDPRAASPTSSGPTRAAIK
jgi:hypothetical protein